MALKTAPVRFEYLIINLFLATDGRKEELDHDSGRILSIDKETEEVLWEYRTDKGGYIFEPILLEEGIIYAGVTDGFGRVCSLRCHQWGSDLASPWEWFPTPTPLPILWCWCKVVLLCVP